MKVSLTNRRLRCVAAVLSVALLGGVSLALMASGRQSAPSTPGQSVGDDKSARPAPERGAGAVRVRTIRAEREELRRTTTQAAHVEPYEWADLFAKVAGYVDDVHVDIGDRVRKDQVLAELWVPEMEQERIEKEALVDRAKAEVGQADAALKAAEAMVAAARAKSTEVAALLDKYNADVTYHRGEYERYVELAKARSIQEKVVAGELNLLRAAEASLSAAKARVASAQADLQVDQAKQLQAQADLVSAHARLKVALADLDRTLVLMRYARITAPYDGVITRRYVHPGAFIQSGAEGKTDPLLSLARVDRLRIVTEVPEAESAWVRVGQPATLRVDVARGTELHGNVARCADALDRQTRTMLVEVELDQPSDVLRPGQYGSVTIALADYPDALLVPANALLPGAGKPCVMVVNDGKAERCELQLGYNDGIRVQVTAGLQGDEQIINEGKNTVREGEAVDVIH
jgi:RND family efflux transporter MFP subunit